MKEQPTHDYPLVIRDAGDELLDGFDALVGPAFVIDVNRAVSIAVLPELPSAPWPPPFPSEWDIATSRPQALGHAFATMDLTIVPAGDRLPGRESVRFPEAPELAHTVFWIEPGQHRALMLELDALGRRAGGVTRSELEAGPLSCVLDQLLPQAELGDAQRALLMLDAPQAAVAHQMPR